MIKINFLAVFSTYLFTTLFTVTAGAAPLANSQGKYFDRAIFVIFENTHYLKTMQQPFFKQLANDGALFTNFVALTHPSQGNYIGLAAGSVHGIKDDKLVDIDAKNIVDLLEAKNLSWKVYAEDYPGGCFTGKSSKAYYRKHNPFISFKNIQSSPDRCANIVSADEFDKDAASGRLPNYVFYVPNMKNDGHDTGVPFADAWYSQKFSKYVKDSTFMKKTILISTFDEDGGTKQNQIYTSIVGPDVKPGRYSDALNIYSLLKLVEDNWNLGNLGTADATAAEIPNIWN
jgi:hypothetical protein